MASCSKNESTGVNDSNKRFLEAWLKVNHPNAVKDGLGIYILDETPGSGKTAGKPEDYPYAYLEYTSTDLEGNIIESTEASVAKQLGSYADGNYYGPVIRLRNSTAMTAGQEMVLNSMNVGGRRKAVIPGWFNTTNFRYKSEEEYLRMSPARISSSTSPCSTPSATSRHGSWIPSTDIWPTISRPR